MKIAYVKDPSGYKILVIALAVSIIWHILCLSAVKIVSSPMPESPVKYSNVSFLGPILSTSSIELRAAPASRSFLERRFNDMVNKAFLTFCQPPIKKELGFGERDTENAIDQTMSALVDAAVSREKFEPDFPAD